MRSHIVERDGWKSEVYLGDCVEGMKQYPDKYFDLAVVDPPYGIGADRGTGRSHRSTLIRAVKGLSMPSIRRLYSKLVGSGQGLGG